MRRLEGGFCLSAAGITDKRKDVECQKGAEAVNYVRSVLWTLEEVKKQCVPF